MQTLPQLLICVLLLSCVFSCSQQVEEVGGQLGSNNPAIWVALRNNTGTSKSCDPGTSITFVLSSSIDLKKMTLDPNSFGDVDIKIYDGGQLLVKVFRADDHDHILAEEYQIVNHRRTVPNPTNRSREISFCQTGALNLLYFF